MCFFTVFAHMFVTNGTVSRGFRSVTEMTAYHVLEAEVGVHGEIIYYKVKLKNGMKSLSSECHNLELKYMDVVQLPNDVNFIE